MEAPPPTEAPPISDLVNTTKPSETKESGEPEQWSAEPKELENQSHETQPSPPALSNHSIVPDGDGWIELDDEGTPLGRWDWDPIDEVWIFDPFTPLRELPATGIPNVPLWIPILGMAVLGIGVLLKRKEK